MTDRIYFAPLNSGDAGDIRRLQKLSFPPELQEPVEEIAALLKNTDEHLVCNFSFGLYVDSNMVGYVFAYVESTSIFHEREEEVLYIKEIVLLPGYEGNLRRSFSKLFQQWSAFTPGMPLEAHVLEESLHNWKRLARVFRFYGLTTSAKPQAFEEGQPPYHLLRLEVAAPTSELAEMPLKLSPKSWSYDEGVRVSVVTDSRQWLSLRPHWDALLCETIDSNVFQSFEYLWQWWKYYGIWNELRVFVIRRGEIVLGIVPMMLEHFSIYGSIVRKLLFIAAPMEMSRPKLIFGNNDTECMPAFFAYLEKHQDDWDIVDIDEQPTGAQLDAIGRELSLRNYLVASSETICPHINMDGVSWASFKSSISRKMRSNINRLQRRLGDLGEVSVRCENHWPALDDALNQYCDIESRSWKAMNSLDIASDRASTFFYRGLARRFGEHSGFELRVLECDSQPIAATFGILDRGVFQSIKIAHDRKYDKYSPGTVLESYELEDLFGRDVASYEFMGSFLSNKLRWTSSVYRTSNVHIYQRRFKLMMFFFVFFVLKRKIKSALKKMGQLENVDRFLKKFPNNPFIRY